MIISFSVVGVGGGELAIYDDGFEVILNGKLAASHPLIEGTYHSEYFQVTWYPDKDPCLISIKFHGPIPTIDYSLYLLEDGRLHCSEAVSAAALRR
ncbi:MAG: hypothetical protein PHC51_12045 [bacterium]|nr:hypothetical protein [bacterium]